MSPPADIHDPSSSAYKKARRQYLKTTRSRGHQLESDWSSFRAAEKKYKARFPPPDLSNVLDLDEARADEVRKGGWSGRADAVMYKEIMLKDECHNSLKKAFIVPRIPGLVILPSFVSQEEQKRLIRWSLRDHARHPNESNLDTHYILPQEGLWNTYLKSRQSVGEDETIQPRASSSKPVSSEDLAPGPRQLISNTPASPDTYLALATSPKSSPPPSTTVHPTPASALIRKLRWANIGWFYHWGSKQYDFSRGKVEVDRRVKELCRKIVRMVDWKEVFNSNEVQTEDWGRTGPDWMDWDETYDPDAGIVNFYQTKDTLMAHVDRSEVCATSPLVSISLGNAAVFLIGGLTRDVEPIPILLRSGDAVVMSGPGCRRAYHGVPRILENTLPPHLENKNEDPEWEPYAEYMRTARININVRQVFPKGFDPSQQVRVTR